MDEVNSSAAKLAVELWKLLGAFERAAMELPTGRQARVAAQLRFTRNRLETLTGEAGLRLITFDGEPFTANIPASPVNAEDITTPDQARVIATVEPAVVTDGRVVLSGRVLLGE